MTASLVENEKLHFWYFNLDPALNPDNLAFTPVSGAAAVSGIDTGADESNRAGRPIRHRIRLQSGQHHQLRQQ
jgi:hypothetical protein